VSNTAPLGDVIEYVRGITFKPEDKVEPGGTDAVVCMRTKNVQEILDQSDLIAVPSALVRREELYLREGDILLSSANSWNLVGKVCRVPHLSYKATAGGFISIVRAKESVDARYLFYWLSSSSVQARIRACARQTTNIANLSVGQFERLAIPLPALADQRRLADILDKADAIRNKRREEAVLTEELLTSAFLHIVGPAAEGSLDWPIATVESLAARTPNAMRTGPFGSDLLHSEFVTEGIAVLGIDNAVQNRFAWAQRRFITPEKYERLRRYTVHPDDVIVTIMGTTGRSAVVPRDIPTAITTKHLATITVDRERAEPEFVSQALVRHPDVLRQIDAANRGAIMSGLNLGLIKGLQVSVPPLERQRAFARAAEQIRSLADRVEYRRLDEDLFNSLRAQAFSGKLPRGNAEC
jgi:type I restriction enzyme S subunit